MKVKALSKQIRIFAFAAIFFAPLASAMPNDFTRMYVFGDSLSDIGNLNYINGGSAWISGRYDNGRFTNGPAWVDALAAAFGINSNQFVPSLSPQASKENFAANYSIDFAYGGAATGLNNTTPIGDLHVRGLQGQVADFSALAASAGGVTDAQHSLYTIWAGANDYLLGGNPATGIPAPDSNAIVGNVTGAIQALYNEGARNFLVPTMVDFGSLPIVASLGTAAQAQFSALAQEYNALLLSALQSLRLIDPGITFYTPDIFGLYRDILADPGMFGFAHGLTEFGPATGCLILPPPCLHAPVDWL
jgi:phospholipase/lecithinase/hemolysin